MKRALAWFAIIVWGLLFLLASVCGAAEPRGIRNNNPGNIMAPASGRLEAWPGAAGVDDVGYMVFARRIDGVRAIVINLRAYAVRHELRSVRGIIGRWTRQNDTKESREAYILFVSRRLGVRPKDRLRMSDPRVLKALTKAIVFYENGQDPYPESLYRRVFPSL